jgi:hypothetical protein
MQKKCWLIRNDYDDNAASRGKQLTDQYGNQARHLLNLLGKSAMNQRSSRRDLHVTTPYQVKCK